LKTYLGNWVPFSPPNQLSCCWGLWSYLLYH